MPTERAPVVSTEQSLTQELGITEQEIARRKEFLEFGDEDVQRLVGLNDLAQRYADSVIEDFYRHLLSFEEGRAFFTDPNVLEYVKHKQKEYFLRLTEGNYDAEYVEDRLRIGAIHKRINLPTKLYIGMYSFYLRAIASRLLKAYPEETVKAFAIFLSLLKLVFLDVNLAIDTYVFKRERAERERTEEARNFLAAIVESSDDAIIGTALDGSIVSWNNGAQRIYGYSADEVKGKPLFILSPADQADEVARLLERLRRGERIHGETTHLRKDGKRIDISHTVSPIRDAARRIIGASAVARDITESKLVKEAIRELSTPVLQVRPGMLILPMIGVIDSTRALQLTEQLLRTIRGNRAKVAVMDITGVPIVDSRVANHLIQTVEAARLMGATVILTGISPEIARTLVTLGVDLTRIRTVGDLQGGIEEAERVLGYRVIKAEDAVLPDLQPSVTGRASVTGRD